MWKEIWKDIYVCHALNLERDRARDFEVLAADTTTAETGAGRRIR